MIDLLLNHSKYDVARLMGANPVFRKIPKKALIGFIKQSYYQHISDGGIATIRTPQGDYIFRVHKGKFEKFKRRNYGQETS